MTAFHNFIKDESEQILICTHATLRFAFEGLDETVFNDTLIAIDEFHHVSADVNNRLGDIIRSIMKRSSAHLIAMTGSYFRGDSVPVLHPEDEAKFTKVTYNYYQQLNGYNYLKSLGDRISLLSREIYRLHYGGTGHKQENHPAYSKCKLR